MSLPIPEPGLVIRYSYLWHEEHVMGQEEGKKDRPCAIILNIKRSEDKTMVVVVPITHTLPKNMSDAVEIPTETKRRLGLDDQRSWILTNQVNRFMWPGPDLRPIAHALDQDFCFGFLPRSVFAEVKEKFFSSVKAQKLLSVSRTE